LGKGVTIGRPRDKAPQGYVTVRETAEILGVSEQAVRRRMDRGTLPQRTETLQSGEIRRYVPREALTDISKDANEVAAKEGAEPTVAGEVVKRLDALTERLEQDAEQRQEVIELLRKMVDQEAERQIEIEEKEQEPRSFWQRLFGT
jgi:predicted transcriptional regulator